MAGSTRLPTNCGRVPTWHRHANTYYAVGYTYAFVPLHGMAMGMGVEADSTGTLRGRTSFGGTFVGKTWHINVHTGPGLGTMAQFRVLACGVLR